MALPDQTPSDEERTLRVDCIVPGGDGLARRADGCVVFIPRTAPGDVVEVEYTEERRNWRRARVVRLVTPGKDRCVPPCQYYDRCGGCQLQHLSYQAQLDAKAAVVLDCLRRLGGVELPQLDVEPSPKQLAYRNRISLTVRSSGTELLAGYHGLDDPDSVVDIVQCPLAEEPINSAWGSLRANLQDLTRRRRADARLTVRATTDGQVGLVIESEKGGTTMSESVRDVAGIDAVWWVDRKGRLTAGSRDQHLQERWGPYQIPLPGSAFLQVNREAAVTMDIYVRSQCHGEPGHTVIDAYCGFGLRSLELAREGKQVTAIDVDGLSVEVGSRLASEHGLAVRFVAAAVERILESILPADIVILNPPRRGVVPRVLKALTKQPPTRIVYVSCDPATLARDIKGLGTRYRLTQCRAFDLFPQTAHVETVATLTRLG
jgi:23S rRNA (uracil1939-C5)-methyltransferase